jgi:hypothetical protein
MPDSDFAAAILETEVVVSHIEDGHVFHFPILSNGAVSLHGARMEPNPAAKREARLRSRSGLRMELTGQG